MMVRGSMRAVTKLERVGPEVSPDGVVGPAGAMLGSARGEGVLLGSGAEVGEEIGVDAPGVEAGVGVVGTRATAFPPADDVARVVRRDVVVVEVVEVVEVEAMVDALDADVAEEVTVVDGDETDEAVDADDVDVDDADVVAPGVGVGVAQLMV